MRPPAQAASSATTTSSTRIESANSAVFQRGRLPSSIVPAQCIIADRARKTGGGRGGTPPGRTRMSFMALGQWMQVLDKEGERRRIPAEVDWDREVGAIARRVLEKKGPALLFENIKGYQRAECTKLMTGGLGDSRRLALALGFPKDASNREMVQHAM